MSRKLVIDNFAGGGGASHGIEAALGFPIDVAVNHDEEAIAMHVANHPETRHLCQSIMAIDPQEACSVDGKVQESLLWWFSPDCKHHSKAKGGKPRDRRIRDLAWVVVHWIERLGDKAADIIMLENVEEFRKWGPLDENNKPIKERAGEEFDLWVRRIRKLGYVVEYRELVAADYGAPTTRKRLYLVARRDGQPIIWPEPTHAPRDSEEVAQGRKLPWVPAADCIDWSIPCPSIFDRDKPLKPNTLRRIAHGVMRYVVDAAEPFIVPVTNSKWGGDRSWTAEEPLRTVTTAKGGEFTAVDAGIVPLTHSGGPQRGQSSEVPFPTITAANRGEFARLMSTVAPLFTRTAHGEQDSTGKKRGRGHHGAQEPYPTVTQTRDSALTSVQLAPHITKFRGGAIGSDAGEPMPTITANGEAKRPAGAQPLALAGATLVQTGYGERKGQAPRSLDPRRPLGTVVAGGSKHALAAAMLSQFRGSNKTGSGGDPAEPAKAITAGGQHQALVSAHIEQANGGPRNKNLVGRGVEAPMSTVTSKGSQQRLVETTLIEKDALPADLMAKATQTAAFLMVYYGSQQTPEMTNPLPTVTTKDRFAVVTVTIDAVTYVIVDIGMRMLKPRELARAMGLPDSYVLDPVIEKTFANGRKKTRPLTISEQISKIGNMVCPDVACALVKANAVASGEDAAVRVA